MSTTKNLRDSFDKKSEALWEAFRKGQLSHLEFRNKHDNLEAQFNQDLAKARGQSRYWDPLVNAWREVNMKGHNELD